MYARRTAIILSSLMALTAGAVTAQAPAARARTNLILPAREPAMQSATLLDVVRSRLPLLVRHGRFLSDDGDTRVCIEGRRGASGALERASAAASVPVCRMIAVFVDDLRISDAASFLEQRAHDFESIELLGAGAAMQRYGLSGDGNDVLVIWRRGRGPHARS